MHSFTTIFDAGSMSVIDSGMIFVSSFGAIAYSAVAVFAWSNPGSRSYRSRWGITAFAMLPIAYLAFSAIAEALWSFEYATRQYTIIDGCVRHFREVVQTDHDLGVDTFQLDGHSFRLSDSGWRVGYHISHHHGSPIAEGAHLRVFANGPRLLRIDVSSERCPVPS